MPYFQNLPTPFRRRHIWNSLVVLLIVGLTFCWIIYDEHQQTLEAEYRLLEARARNAEGNIDDALDRIELLILQLTEAKLKNRSLRDTTFVEVLTRHKENIPELGTLFVTDHTGHIQDSTDTTLMGRDVSHEPFFTTHQNIQKAPTLFISRPYKNLFQFTSVTFSLPVFDAHHQFTGIAAVAVGFDFFPRIVEPESSATLSSRSEVFNHHGDLLYRSDAPEKYFAKNISGTNKAFDGHIVSALSESHYLGSASPNEKTRLFVTRNVGNTGIGLILSRQRDVVLSRWQRNTVIYALIFIFTSALVISFSILGSRRKRQVLIADQLIATANVMVVGLDESGYVTIFNETAERISGYNCDEILGRHWQSLQILSAATPTTRKIFDSYSKTGELPQTDEYPILTKTSGERIISWRNSVSLEPLAAISFGIDITERTQMEKDLIAAKLLAEEANLAKARFLAAASHDLRQPVHAQGLFLDVLAHTNLSTQQRTLLDNIGAANSAFAEMLNTLLDFSRVEAGVIKPQIQTFRMQLLLNKIEREFEAQADAKGLAYRSRETDITVHSDPALIELILRNLVSNAIRYTEQGGILVTCRKRNGAALLEVRDTGIGIAPAYQQEVFREFHQLGNPERNRLKGLGLGLAISQGLARTLGLSLTLFSIVERGSLFRLTLPLSKKHSPETQSIIKGDMARLQNIQILVIDDDEIVLSGMLELLRSWGCICVAVESIDEAIKQIQIQIPDLIISDYRLHERQTGLDAIIILRKIAERTLPALLITGDTAPDRLREALASGIPLLHKPVPPELLFNSIINALSRTSYRNL